MWKSASEIETGWKAQWISLLFELIIDCIWHNKGFGNEIYVAISLNPIKKHYE